MHAHVLLSLQHTHTRTRVHTRAHAHTHVHIHTWIKSEARRPMMCTLISCCLSITHTRARAHTHTCTQTHMRTHTHAHTHTCTHTHLDQVRGMKANNVNSKHFASILVEETLCHTSALKFGQRLAKFHTIISKILTSQHSLYSPSNHTHNTHIHTHGSPMALRYMSAREFGKRLAKNSRHF